MHSEGNPPAGHADPFILACRERMAGASSDIQRTNVIIDLLKEIGRRATAVNAAAAAKQRSAVSDDTHDAHPTAGNSAGLSQQQTTSEITSGSDLLAHRNRESSPRAAAARPVTMAFDDESPFGLRQFTSDIPEQPSTVQSLPKAPSPPCGTPGGSRRYANPRGLSVASFTQGHSGPPTTAAGAPPSQDRRADSLQSFDGYTAPTEPMRQPTAFVEDEEDMLPSEADDDDLDDIDDGLSSSNDGDGAAAAQTAIDAPHTSSHSQHAVSGDAPLLSVFNNTLLDEQAAENRSNSMSDSRGLDAAGSSLTPAQSKAKSSSGPGQSSTGGLKVPKMDFNMSSTAIVDRDASGVLMQVNDLEMYEEIGHGAYGHVFIGSSPRYEQLVAIKELPRRVVEHATDGPRQVNVYDGASLTSAPSTPQSLATKLMVNLIHEADVMSRLKHDNIVQIYEAIDDPKEDAVYLVMEFVDGTPAGHADECNTMELETLGCATMTGGFSCTQRDERVQKLVARGVASALLYCQGRKVVHGDVKPENILLEFEPQPPGRHLQEHERTVARAKLADFGVAVTLQGGEWRFADIPTPQPLGESVMYDGGGDESFGVSFAPWTPASRSIQPSPLAHNRSPGMSPGGTAGGSAVRAVRAMGGRSPTSDNAASPARSSRSMLGVVPDEQESATAVNADDTIMQDQGPTSARGGGAPPLTLDPSALMSGIAPAVPPPRGPDVVPALAPTDGPEGSATNSANSHVVQTLPPSPSHAAKARSAVPPANANAGLIASGGVCSGSGGTAPGDANASATRPPVGTPAATPDPRSHHSDDDSDEEERLRLQAFGNRRKNKPNSLDTSGATPSPTPISPAKRVARGTPAFLAPELVTGVAPHPTPASDAWALGVTLFGLRYGYLPFAGGSRMQLCDAIVHADPRFPPMEAAPGSEQWRTERRWRSVLRGLLQKEPSARLTTRELLRTALLRGVQQPAASPARRAASFT